MQQACVIHTGRLLSQRDFIFVLRFPLRPLSGLVGEAASPPFLLLTQLSQLASTLGIFLEGVCHSYTCSEISISLNMAQVSLKVFVSKSHYCRQDLFFHPLGTACRSILFSSSGGILLEAYNPGKRGIKLFIYVSRAAKLLKGMSRCLCIAHLDREN